MNNVFYSSDHVNILQSDIANEDFNYWHIFLRRNKIVNSFLKSDIGFARELCKQGFDNILMFAINQHYPEFASSFYQNPRITFLIQKIASEESLGFVPYDNYTENGIMPIEILGSLQNGQYCFIDMENHIKGGSIIWDMQGGKNMFLHDRRIMLIMAKAQTNNDILSKFLTTTPSKHWSLIESSTFE